MASAPEIRVRVAEYAVARGEGTIATLGLGSCVAIMLYAPGERVGALAHVLLPEEELSRDRSNPAKFASTAVPMLLAEVRARGGTGPVVAKIAGGASMFGALLSGSGLNMGDRNLDATRRALAAANIPLVAEDVGGDFGRNVYLHLADGRVTVRSLRRGDHVL
jgi:chemotaxis protein CheD